MPSAPGRKTSYRRSALLAAAAGLGLVLGYQEYRHGSVSKAKAAWRQWRTTFAKYSTAAGAGADILTAVLSDLRDYVQSDREELPQSVKQLARLAKSKEVAEAAAAWVHAACSHSSSSASSDQPQQPAGPDLFDRVLAALTAERSQSVIALAVSVACRSSVEAVVQATMQQPQHSPAQAAGRESRDQADQGLVLKLMAWAGTPAGEQLVMKVVSVFTRQGVAQYMSSFDTDANIFDDLLSAVSKPGNLPTSEKFARLFINEIIHSWAGNSIIHRPSVDAAADILRTASTRLPPPMAAHVLRAASCCTLPEEASISPTSSTGDPSCPPRDAACPSRAFSLPPRSSSSPQGLDRDIDSACESAAAEEALASKPSRRLHLSGSGRAPEMVAPVVVAVKTNWMDSVSQMLMKPEARTLILQMTPLVVGEAVRATAVCSRDMLLGRLTSSSSGMATVSTLHMYKTVIGAAALMLIMAVLWQARQAGLVSQIGV